MMARQIAARGPPVRWRGPAPLWPCRSGALYGFLMGFAYRIAPLDQRTALPDQCLHPAEADVRPPRRKSGFAE